MITENLVPIGILTISIGFILVIVGAIFQASKAKTEVGIVGFVGPVPIGFGTSKNVLYLTIALSLIVLVIFLIINKGIIFK